VYYGEKPRGGEQNNTLEAIREMTLAGVERFQRACPGPSQSTRKQSTNETTGPVPGGRDAANKFGESE
jgi:hypothetical protein